MMYPLVSELAVDGVPVTVTCRVLKLVRQDYYRWLVAPITASELEEAYLANALFDAHHDDPEFGYDSWPDEVDDRFGACERIVWKVCSQNGWWSSFGKKKTRKKAKVHTPAHDDLVKRQLGRRPRPTMTGRPNRRPDEGYGSSYRLHSSQKARLPSTINGTSCGSAAVSAGCIFHTDRGSQFRSRKVHRALTRHRMVGSMGQVG